MSEKTRAYVAGMLIAVAALFGVLMLGKWLFPGFKLPEREKPAATCPRKEDCPCANCKCNLQGGTDRPRPHIIFAGNGQDGAGLTVNASIETLALRQGIQEFRGFHAWSKRYDGGSWPEKLRAQLRQYQDSGGMDTSSLYASAEGLSWEDVAAMVKQGYPCVMATARRLPQWEGGVDQVHTTIILLDVGRTLSRVMDTNFPDLGEFTLPNNMLKESYNANKGNGWVVFVGPAAKIERVRARLSEHNSTGQIGQKK